MSSEKGPRRQILEHVSTSVAAIVSLLSLWVAIGSEKANRQMVAAASWRRRNVGADGRQLQLPRAADAVQQMKYACRA